MLNYRTGWKLLFLIGVISGVAAAQSVPPKKDIMSIAKAANGSIVSVVMSDKDGKPIAQGSGFFVSKDGLIVTNYHVISEGSSAVVKLPDGAFFTVDGVLAFDKARDVAIIKAHGKSFQPLILGNSDRVRVGEEVVAIGNPLSLESTVSNGIVSAKRTLEDLGDNFLQITAPISPGSSGGPLFNMAGEVVGITTMYLKEGENLNFAIPVNEAKRIFPVNLSKMQALPNELESKEEAKRSRPYANPKFPENDVQALQTAGNLPTWANYVCWDTTPGLQSSWLLLLAYSPKVADADAVRASVLKAITFQEYLDTQPMNPPATTTELAQALPHRIKDGDEIPERIFEAAEQMASAVENAEHAASLHGIDFENLKKTPGMTSYLYFLQKYVNTDQPGNPFGIRLTETDLKGAELGTILYETAPQSNVFRTPHIDAHQENRNVASIVIQTSSEGMRFTFVRSVYGEMSLPISGVCRPVER